MRSGCGRGTPGLAHAAADHGHDQDGRHVVQPGHRRSSQRSDCQRNRRARRTDGPHHRPHGRAIPDAQPLQGRRHVEPAGAMRQNALFGGVAPHAGEHLEPLYLAGCGYGTAFRHRSRAAPRSGRPHPLRGGIRLPGRRADRRNVPRRDDALRRFACRRGQGRGRRIARYHAEPQGPGVRLVPHRQQPQPG